MAELTPLEKLQPCLLDRLTDEDPKVTEESKLQRVVSLARYKRGVLRDLEWLLNASAHFAFEGGLGALLVDYPEARQSVVNYGTRHLCGLVGPEMVSYERELVEAIQVFEPRILRNTLSIRAVKDRQIVGLEIEGELWANPVPDHLFIKTKIDLETGQTVLGDAING